MVPFIPRIQDKRGCYTLYRLCAAEIGMVLKSSGAEFGMVAGCLSLTQIDV